MVTSVKNCFKFMALRIWYDDTHSRVDYVISTVILNDWCYAKFCLPITACPLRCILHSSGRNRPPKFIQFNSFTYQFSTHWPALCLGGVLHPVFKSNCSDAHTHAQYFHIGTQNSTWAIMNKKKIPCMCPGDVTGITDSR